MRWRERERRGPPGRAARTESSDCVGQNRRRAENLPEARGGAGRVHAGEGRHRTHPAAAAAAAAADPRAAAAVAEEGKNVRVALRRRGLVVPRRRGRGRGRWRGVRSRGGGEPAEPRRIPEPAAAAAGRSASGGPNKPSEAAAAAEGVGAEAGGGRGRGRRGGGRVRLRKDIPEQVHCGRLGRGRGRGRGRRLGSWCCGPAPFDGKFSFESKAQQTLPLISIFQREAGEGAQLLSLRACCFLQCQHGKIRRRCRFQPMLEDRKSSLQTAMTSLKTPAALDIKLLLQLQCQLSIFLLLLGLGVGARGSCVLSTSRQLFRSPILIY